VSPGPVSCAKRRESRIWIPEPSLPIRRNRIALITLWALQVGLAAMFLLAGGSKLAGASAMVALFDEIGVGQWFRYVTGLIEVVSAVALLVPAPRNLPQASAAPERSHRSPW
jgi:putative oxidoreductase